MGKNLSEPPPSLQRRRDMQTGHSLHDYGLHYFCQSFLSTKKRETQENKYQLKTKQRVYQSATFAFFINTRGIPLSFVVWVVYTEIKRANYNILMRKRRQSAAFFKERPYLYNAKL
jgi:hypothetical protein